MAMVWEIMVRTDADISEGPIRSFEDFPDVRGFSKKLGCSLELSRFLTLFLYHYSAGLQPEC
jgi:hypothetical protein